MLQHHLVRVMLKLILLIRGVDKSNYIIHWIDVHSSVINDQGTKVCMGSACTNHSHILYYFGANVYLLYIQLYYLCFKSMYLRRWAANVPGRMKLSLFGFCSLVAEHGRQTGIILFAEEGYWMMYSGDMTFQTIVVCFIIV